MADQEPNANVSLTLDELSYLLYAVGVAADRAQPASPRIAEWERSLRDKLGGAEKSLVQQDVGLTQYLAKMRQPAQDRTQPMAQILTFERSR